MGIKINGELVDVMSYNGVIYNNAMYNNQLILNSSTDHTYTGVEIHKYISYNNYYGEHSNPYTYPTPTLGSTIFVFNSGYDLMLSGSSIDSYINNFYMPSTSFKTNGSTEIISNDYMVSNHYQLRNTIVNNGYYYCLPLYHNPLAITYIIIILSVIYDYYPSGAMTDEQLVELLLLLFAIICMVTWQRILKYSDDGTLLNIYYMNDTSSYENVLYKRLLHTNTKGNIYFENGYEVEFIDDDTFGLKANTVDVGNWCDTYVDNLDYKVLVDVNSDFSIILLKEYDINDNLINTFDITSYIKPTVKMYDDNNDVYYTTYIASVDIGYNNDNESYFITTTYSLIAPNNYDSYYSPNVIYKIKRKDLI